MRIVTPGGPPSAGRGTLAEEARRILDVEVNPAISAHRGHVTVVGADQGWVRIRLEGGCQGCSLAEVTLRQGIEPLLRARLPGLAGLADVTDHQADGGTGACQRPGPPRRPRCHVTRPSGVLMLPVPRPGVLRAVEGRAAAAAVPGITGLTITIPAGQRVRPLPEGDRYLGFVFAEGGTCEEVQHALAAARRQLRVVIS